MSVVAAIVTALALVAAEATPTADVAVPTTSTLAALPIRIDLPLVLLAQPPSSGVGAPIRAFVGLRAGYQKPMPQVFDGLALGVDVALLAGGLQTGGTSEVLFGRLGIAIEPRALASVEVVRLPFFRLQPFVFAGARLGAGLGISRVDADMRSFFLGEWAGRLGLGVDLLVWRLVPRLEVGAGLCNGRLEVSSGASVGLAF